MRTSKSSSIKCIKTDEAHYSYMFGIVRKKNDTDWSFTDHDGSLVKGTSCIWLLPRRGKTLLK